MLNFKKHLNQTLGRLDVISDFSNIQSPTPLFDEEYQYLKGVLEPLINEVKVLLERLDRLEKEIEKQVEVIDRETGDDKKEAVSRYNRMLKEAEGFVERINKRLDMVNVPYFGKIVFNRKQQGQFPGAKINSYIGKFAYFDESTRKSLITDWRAPIANLYYTNSGPSKNVSFVSPVGTQTGDLEQKRQFEILEGRISSIYDSKSGNVAADEFLLSQLQKRIGKKLADIVATIQDQQNSIIREPKDRLSIIQGVAGSGKTTIVLHRLAYLLFTYPETLSPEKILLIAPNKMFLDYISEVLPSLGVFGIESNTYIFWAKKVLNWDDSYLLSPQTSLKSKEFKGGFAFIPLLKKYLEEYEEKVLESIPYSRKDSVQKRYYELKESFPQISVMERIKLALERAVLEKQFEKKTTGSFMGIDSISEELRKKIDAYVKRSFDPIKVYKSIFASKKIKMPQEVKKFTQSMLVRKNSVTQYSPEDLAPLIYIYFWLNGNEEHKKEYIVVDEAQDMSPMQLLTLMLIAKQNNLLLAGDLAQSINPPFYIRSWKDLQNALANEFDGIKASYHELNKCYRTTVEIIDYANKLLSKHFANNYNLPEAVLRHGDKVEELTLKNELAKAGKNDFELISASIKKQFKAGSSTVALICRDETHATEVYEAFSKYQNLGDYRIVNSDENNYESGLLILPIARAKGLEFDSVYIVDLNKSRYKNGELDARLLYVGLTRALHRLFIVKNSNELESELINES